MDEPVDAAARSHRRRHVALATVCLVPMWCAAVGGSAVLAVALLPGSSSAVVGLTPSAALLSAAAGGQALLFTPRGTAWREGLPVIDPVAGLAYHCLRVLTVITDDGTMFPLAAALSGASRAADRLRRSTPPGSGLHTAAADLAGRYRAHAEDVFARGARRGAPELTDTTEAAYRLVAGVLAGRGAGR